MFLLLPATTTFFLQAPLKPKKKSFNKMPDSPSDEPKHKSTRSKPTYSKPVALLLANQPLALPTTHEPLYLFPSLYASSSLRNLASEKGFKSVEEMRTEARKIRQGEEKVGIVVECWDRVVVWDRECVAAPELQR